MATEILYFAWVRERIGMASETIALPDGLTTVGDLVSWLAARGGGYAAAFEDRSRLRAAIDQRFVTLDAPLGRPREVALFPPVTGG
ncbi:molybdopterin converting factor subunit 1 [Sphingomonas immobilis]|uniref:Molybdopterin synthase sulfur carrier subunit n=1 Tax=Sphingomonas immobilis TaxID=3063997 RepID=A0ABT8ZXR1_9SPHN|nr:molybdopterin converting factor subunit 1 [Sphingomonas sp. CA1-15]MDO7842371.1 molybdopterin converting factor subunit 1 [Sphingomonas sp. CA1-15]